jgi:SPP1 gp7 family putative phage head morphogenesis protein
VTGLSLQPDRAATIRAALRRHGSVWLQRFYRHEILVGRTVRGMQDEAADLFRREVINPVVQRVAGGLATFDRRGADVLIEATPELRAVMADVEAIIRRGVAGVQRRHENNLRDLVQHESQWVNDSARKVLKVDPPAANVPAIQQAVTQRPYLGGKVEEWFGSLIGGDNGAADNVRFVLREGMARGWSEQEMVRALRGRRDTGYSDGLLSGQNVSQVRGLVRSSAAHASATTRMESFKAIGVDRYRWLATLDTKVCVICAQHEKGSPYPLGEGPLPPAHPHCRCSPVPWFGEPEGTRASTDGPVPADVTVEQWLEGRSIGEQNEVLGKTRAAAWRSGALTMGRMLGADMQPLSIPELRRMDLIPDDE